MKRAPSLLLVAAFVVAAAGTALAGDHKLTYTIDGDAGGDRLGHGVAGVGDVNGDGHDDFIAGAYYGNTSRPGYARVYSGKNGQVIYSLKGSSNYDGFGVSVNAAGDVNADGYADFIIGAHQDDTSGTDAGLAKVYSGKTGSVLYTFTGDGTGDRFGLTSNGAGDVNADGYDDLIVGAYYTGGGSGAGYAKVFSGKNGAVLYTFRGSSTRDYFGVYVSGAGDVNKDGYADVVIGASLDDTKGTDSGKVQVYSGKDGSLLYTWYGDRSYANCGRCVDGAGDVNQDGYDDVVVGAYLDDPNGTDSGTVRVYSGKDGSVLYTWYGDAFDDRLGVHVDGGGDLNNDGYPDIVAGAYCDDENGSNCGSMRAWSGKDGSVLYTFYGQASTVYFGRFACILGDANADGLDDIIVGAYAEDYGGTDTGRVYVYISPAPSGTITINSGDEATSSTSVTLDLTYAPGTAGEAVTDMRFRNAGDAWDAWIPVAGTRSWTIPSGDGTKTVEVQFRDKAGAISGAIADTIILDQTPPTGALIINNGYHQTAKIFVTLNLSYTDLQSGVTHVRFRNQGEAWGNWLIIEDTKSWTLTDLGGIRTVEGQFRDAAGNISEIAADSIEYLADIVAPEIDTVRINNARAYILPDEPLEFGVYARDNLSGAGVDAFKVSFNSGSTWSDWLTLEFGPIVTVERPVKAGLITAVVVVRDGALNESAQRKASFYLLETEHSWLGAGAKCAGRLDSDYEVDAVELGLVAGDLLTVKIQGKALVKKATMALAMDLVRPDGTRLFEGRYPEDSEKLMVKGFAVPETGRYLLIIRTESRDGERTGTYKLTAKVKQAKENKKLKGSFTGSEIPFDATHGAKVKVVLKGDGVAPDNVTVEGPDGPVTVVAKGKPGSVKLTAVVEAGTGTYRIRFAGSVTVSAKVTVKLPKIKGTVQE